MMMFITGSLKGSLLRRCAPTLPDPKIELLLVEELAFLANHENARVDRNTTSLTR
jgi:hypothetical protein